MKKPSTHRPVRGDSCVARLLALCSAALLATQPLQATDTNGTWTVDGNGSWSDVDTVNWSGGTVADGSGFTADFSTIDITADRTVSLAAPRSIGNLTFGDTTTATAAGWTLDNAATPANILTLAGATPTITVNAIGTSGLVYNPKSVVMSGVIAGSGGLTKAGAGRLKLTGANTYTGGTVINGGRLSFVTDNNLGAVPGSFDAANITINNGAILEMTGMTDVRGDGGNITVNANRGITLGDGIQILQRNHRSVTFTIPGVITGSGGLVLSTLVDSDGDQGGGSGWNINGANTYTGDTYLGWGSGEYKGPNTNINHSLALQNSTLNYVNYYGYSENLSRENTVALPAPCTLGGLSGGTNATQVKSLTVPTGLQVGNNNKDTTFSGKLIGGGSLEKIGGGKLTLTSSLNAYTGATTVSAGTLALGATGTIATSASITLKPGALLDTSAKTTYALPASPKTVTFQIDGTNSGSSGRIKAAGLDITTAVVVFTQVNSPLDDSVYVLADYTSLTGSAFASATAPPGYNIDYAYNGGTQIALVSTGGVSAYDSWASAKSLTGANNGKTQDPDNDGRTNLQEFALDGDPLSAANDGKMVAKIATVGAETNVFTLTLPVRAGAVFSGSGGLTSAAIDGVIYHIQGSADLGNFTVNVTEVSPALDAGLPGLSSGWTYRTFRTPGSVSALAPRDFLRVGIEQAP